VVSYQCTRVVVTVVTAISSGAVISVVSDRAFSIWGLVLEGNFYWFLEWIFARVIIEGGLVKWSRFVSNKVSSKFGRNEGLKKITQTLYITVCNYWNCDCKMSKRWS